MAAANVQQRTRRPEGAVWAILLAGGDGTRLRGHVFAGELVDRPKQFCQFGAEKSLLRLTLERASQITSLSRVVPVVSVAHRDWWGTDLKLVPDANILVQPSNRGTALAVLHALTHILAQDDRATIVAFPCDHGLDHEPALLRAVRIAIRAAQQDPRDLVLLGVPPEYPETQYGWVLPERWNEGESHTVRSFFEKPPLETALDLMKQGALWNTLIFATTGDGLLRRYAHCLPSLTASYVRATRGKTRCEDTLTRFYNTVPRLDFSRDVLQVSSGALRVVNVPACGWTDLGTPQRVEAWLDGTTLETPRASLSSRIQIKGRTE